MLTPEALLKRLTDIEIRPHQIVGCTEREVEHVCFTAGLPLPASYRTLLRTIGKGAGWFMRDIDMFYPKMIGLNAEAVDLLNNWEKGQLLLPNHAFVFGIRCWEQFTFFIADEGLDDPPIFYYYEGDHQFTRVADSLWDLIECELMQSEDIYREFHRDPTFRAFL